MPKYCPFCGERSPSWLDEEHYKGYVIELHLDLDPIDPREWDNFGTMVCCHSRYNLGDEQASPEEIKKLMERKDVEYLPLYLLDHGGLWMNTSGFSYVDPQGWDWGMVGIIYVTHERIKQEYGEVNQETIRRALEVLEGEVKTYSAYLQGEVYGFQIRREDSYEIVDSCYGYYEQERALEDAKKIVDRLVESGK